MVSFYFRCSLRKKADACSRLQGYEGRLSGRRDGSWVARVEGDLQRCALNVEHVEENAAHLYTVAAHRSDQVFLPVLENAVKAQKVRSTLGVFEKSKFLFNLPGQLMESIQAVSHTVISTGSSALVTDLTLNRAVLTRL
jgi:hypothetical protein